jgi:predicted CoA-binding protein
MSRPTTSEMQSAAKTFMSAKHIAVAGASSIPSKFGHKIFAWYLDRGIPAVPMNPTLSKVKVQSKEYDTVASPSKLDSPKDTSLSVITPPAITAKILKEAKEVGIKAVWLQPGSFDDEILKYALEAFPGAAVGGHAEGTVGHEGWCVLVDGDEAMAAAGRTESNRQVSARKTVML